MSNGSNYLKINQDLWDKRTDVHFESEFYNVSDFIQGKSSLNPIELELLGDIRGKTVLHLQCHFGQDSISLSRMGAKVTGVDLSPKAIERAEQLATECGTDTEFICCDVYDLPNHLDKEFDIVFTSYGTIGWLPDMDKWAGVVQQFLRPGGHFVFAEFHPVVWMFDEEMKEIEYGYFNTGPIIEGESGTYTDGGSALEGESVGWNHGLAEVMQALLDQGLIIKRIEEFDYSPYPCFKNVFEEEHGKFRFKELKARIPMVYSILAQKSN